MDLERIDEKGDGVKSDDIYKKAEKSKSKDVYGKQKNFQNRFGKFFQYSENKSNKEIGLEFILENEVLPESLAKIKADSKNNSSFDNFFHCLM